MPDPGNVPNLRRRIFVFAAGVAGILLVALMVYFAGLAGITGVLPDSLPWKPPPTQPGLLPPLTPFAQIDPAVLGALEQNLGAYDAVPLAPFGAIPPVGAYLPQAGDAQFDLPTAQPPPTQAPYPTSPFLVQSEDSGILPTEPASAYSGPPPAVYGGDGCAPRGLPVSGVLTQRFHAWHSGVDQGVPVSTPVIATHSGQVLFAGWSEFGYGNLIILQNQAFITYYAHLSAFNVVVDQQVEAGSVIGLSGNTGNSTGPHVHYEVRINDVPVDPLTFEDRGYRWC